MAQEDKMVVPLLSEKEEVEGDKECIDGRSSSYQYVGRAGSVIPTASLAGTEVSVDEIRSAASASSDRYYPPSLHAPLISSPDPDPIDQANLYQGGYGLEYGGMPNEFQRPILDEVEIRELLIDHVGHHCCWGSRPARTWKVQVVEDCNVYVGTLETFIEEREAVKETQPYLDGNVNGKDKGPVLGIWELDLRSEFRFYLYLIKNHGPKFLILKLLRNAQVVQDEEILGLIAHRDGSDTICVKCDGKGKFSCATCGSRGLVKCQTCKGNGSLLTRNIAIVRWKTLCTRKVSATTGAASVPDEVFHRAKGVQLCNTQAQQCTPAFFADSFFLNKFSSEVIADRAPVPPTARVICERHTVSVVPVTRVTMADHCGRSFSFYVIGFSREVYLKDYYPAKFCWGLCSCLDWLKL
ncbi:hypothetical protein U1Q18_048379 [Sarracenia purpurea var. burkii]